MIDNIIDSIFKDVNREGLYIRLIAVWAYMTAAIMLNTVGPFIIGNIIFWVIYEALKARKKPAFYDTWWQIYNWNYRQLFVTAVPCIAGAIFGGIVLWRH